MSASRECLQATTAVLRNSTYYVARLLPAVHVVHDMYLVGTSTTGE